MVVRPLGPLVASWLLLARLGPGPPGGDPRLAVRPLQHRPSSPTSRPGRPAASCGLLGPGGAARPCSLAWHWRLAGILLHDAFSGDFLGFLPDGIAPRVEGMLDIPAPAPGEGSRWRHGIHQLPLGRPLRCLAGRPHRGRRRGRRLADLRPRRPPAGPGRSETGSPPGAACWPAPELAALAPGGTAAAAQVLVRAQGWPDVVLLIDDSQSMSTVDHYRDTQIQAVADRLAQHDGMTKNDRLSLAQALVTRANPDWLTALLTERKVRVHVYHCSGRAHRLSDVNSAEDIGKGIEASTTSRPSPPTIPASSARPCAQVLNDFRGSSLAAVVMLTDGVTTEGEDLPRCRNTPSRWASRCSSSASAMPTRSATSTCTTSRSRTASTSTTGRLRGRVYRPGLQPPQRPGGPPREGQAEGARPEDGPVDAANRPSRCASSTSRPSRARRST